MVSTSSSLIVDGVPRGAWGRGPAMGSLSVAQTARLVEQQMLRAQVCRSAAG